VRKLLAASVVALVAAGTIAAPARAAEGQAYAAALNYATPALFAGQGDTLRFNNLDTIAQHDLVSDVPGEFGSALIPAGQAAPVDGVDKLPAGTYGFHCSLHSWMHGELDVAPAGSGGSPGPPQPPSGPPSGPPAANPADLLPHVPPAPLADGEWPFYGGDLANSRSGTQTAPSYNEVPTLSPVWSFESTDGDFTGTPVVAQGTLVVGSSGGTVYALDAATGKTRWTRQLKVPINGSAAISSGRVFVPLADTGKPRVAALDLRDGSILWQTVVDTQKDADVFGSPVVWQQPATPAKPKRARHKRRRHHARHRRHKHKHRRHKHRRRHRAPKAQQTVFIGTSSYYGEVNNPDVHTRGSVVAIDAATGRIRWKTFAVPDGHDGGAVWSTPAVDPDSGRVYVGTGNAYHEPVADTTDSILALDGRDGRILAHLQATADDAWNATSEQTAGPDYDFGASPNLFTDARGHKLVGAGQKSGVYWALDRDTLKPVWTASTGPGAPAVGGIVGSTAVSGSRIFGPDTPAGEVWALGDDGSSAWASSDGGPLQFSAVSAGNGVVYTTTLSGTLTARDATTGVVLAKLPLGGPSWGGVSLAGGSVFAVTGTQTSSGWVVAYRPRG
jgi:polyvinyl alcohol dehydrogenase (cytochrome)